MNNQWEKKRLLENEDIELNVVKDDQKKDENDIDDIPDYIDEQGTKIYNNWTDGNVKTVRSWKSSVSKASFIYQSILEKNKKLLNKLLVISLIFSTISTIVSGISSTLLTVDNQNYKWVAFMFNVVLFILSGAVSILSGAIKIYKLDDLVSLISTYIEKLDSFYATISSELILHPSLRHDAISFIKKEDSSYLNMMLQSPDVYPSDYDEANQKYLKHIEDDTINSKYSQKYNDNDNVIDIV